MRCVVPKIHGGDRAAMRGLASGNGAGLPWEAQRAGLPERLSGWAGLPGKDSSGQRDCRYEILSCVENMAWLLC